jgi:hypothetical protein
MLLVWLRIRLLLLRIVCVVYSYMICSIGFIQYVSKYIQRIAKFHLRVVFEEVMRKLDFCLTVHHQLGKVIQMNQLDATKIY